MGNQQSFATILTILVQQWTLLVNLVLSVGKWVHQLNQSPSTISLRRWSASCSRICSPRRLCIYGPQMIIWLESEVLRRAIIRFADRFTIVLRWEGKSFGVWVAVEFWFYRQTFTPIRDRNWTKCVPQIALTVKHLGKLTSAYFHFRLKEQKFLIEKTSDSKEWMVYNCCKCSYKPILKTENPDKILTFFKRQFLLRYRDGLQSVRSGTPVRWFESKWDYWEFSASGSHDGTSIIIEVITWGVRAPRRMHENTEKHEIHWNGQ